MKMENFYNRISELSKKEPKQILEMGLKLSEECGEVSEAILSINNSSGSSYKDKDYSHLQEELVDVAIIALSMLSRFSVDIKSIEETFNKKINKWENNINN